MPEEPLDSESPPDEAWWERELHRNEKLMDKYMAVLGDNPDWDKWQTPEDLYNKVHFNLEPPERGTVEAGLDPQAETPEDQWLSEANSTTQGPDRADEDADWADADENPTINEDYPAVSRQAREFAGHVFDLKNPPGNAELLFLSAGKVDANLAGGHGLGYDEDSICGNIVKCRWALSDCEFCREILEDLQHKTGDATYAALVEESRRLAELIRERIARLRQRVWW
jgi:hypothetical protein